MLLMMVLLQLLLLMLIMLMVVQMMAAGGGGVRMMMAQMMMVIIVDRKQIVIVCGQRRCVGRFEEARVKAEHVKVSGRRRFGQQECVMRWGDECFQPFHDHGSSW